MLNGLWTGIKGHFRRPREAGQPPVWVQPYSRWEKLSPEKEAELRAYARENDPPGANWRVTCHPVAVEEWEKRLGGGSV